MSLICPKPECRQPVATRDNKHYGVHFHKVTDIKPCPMSCKPMVEEKVKEQSMTLPSDWFLLSLEKFTETVYEQTGNRFVEEIVLTPEGGFRLAGLRPGQKIEVSTSSGPVIVRADITHGPIV